MDITEQVALVTGANRGIGRQFVEELKDRGVKKIYATARRPESLDIPGVEVLGVDVTDHDSVVAAARAAADVTMLINNAGVSTGATLITGDLAEIRREFDTHFWGTLDVIRTFAPILASNGGGSITNMLSALSWFSTSGAGAYAAAKAAEWNMTNAVRLELAGQGTFVQGIHLGAADTDMMSGYEGPMTSPREVAKRALDGLAAGSIEVVIDDWSAMVKASLADDPQAFYDRLATLLG